MGNKHISYQKFHNLPIEEAENNSFSKRTENSPFCKETENFPVLQEAENIPFCKESRFLTPRQFLPKNSIIGTPITFISCIEHEANEQIPYKKIQDPFTTDTEDLYNCEIHQEHKLKPCPIEIKNELEIKKYRLYADCIKDKHLGIKKYNLFYGENYPPEIIDRFLRCPHPDEFLPQQEFGLEGYLYWKCKRCKGDNFRTQAEILIDKQFRRSLYP